MVAERVPCDDHGVDFRIIGEKLKFNCGRECTNRFLKAALSEHHGTFNPSSLEDHGLPKESLINMYEKWGNGGFGMVLTGNTMIDMEVGYDFVELSGGTYEKLQMHHVRESTKKREAFFLEFTDKIRPVFRNTKMFVTGGFRTVKGMVRAIENDECDGIGLGRPITAEPDLPKKLIAGQVSSAADTKIGQNMITSGAAAAVQMWQAGERSLAESSGDPCDGIADLSDQLVADEFNQAREEFEALVQRNRAAGLPIPNNGMLAWYPKNSKYSMEKEEN